MAYSILKIVAYGFAWTAPIFIPVMVHRWMGSRSIASGKRRLVQALLLPLVWAVGWTTSIVGHSFHEAAWFAAHPDGVRTEMDMMELGDYPNVLSVWILLGWVPVMLGWFLAVRDPMSKWQGPSTP